MAKKTHVALLFGGNSSEHDVSKRSAHNVFDALDKEKYEISIFMFSKDGILLGNQPSQRIFDGESEEVVVAEEMEKMDLSNPLAPIAALSEVRDIDIFWPVIHGNLGEDGTVQGLFKLLNKPFIGAPQTASGMAFDKELTKRILNQAGVRNTEYVLVTPENRANFPYEQVAKKLGEVLFIKPAKQGSSVGMAKVKTASEYDQALTEALRYDFKVLVEKTIKNPREIEISILGNEEPKASKLGEVIVPSNDEFYDYNNKFVDASGVVFDLPAVVEPQLAQEITQMSLKAYEALELKGLTRIDFLVDENNVPYLGEPNTLPGMTNISLYPQMWEVSGISYSQLLDEIIKYGFAEFDRNSKISYAFQSLGEEHVGEKRYTQD
ncbi:D-alanine--D-alanine ligase family protein [Periweissella beninensis]|uniref:D-alanine--D-alanine ligase n=1 Tax=Periweissella beninensis TaxID=504936 RepID=A0ABT0VHZ0_9LACO|nr:D-alanine--D-alanine ligase family protein [Periweissella beninensis]MBM7544001.1 D-alanine-D-alanine ligase [Periweissella beninensis]MCM2437441.1 D-alanine--D-alanine ligase [Periweissella beninensis]MCT4396510.1 D-alanine--D-alanine ligase [Periweissella beninensis]